ncbi:5314_t:CDS:2 [Ambispora gerdemannii]|uniref:5314_t:CDS:1 n=1 Tax=Ambispora gerdemannii TaxID=144530 RepID=A0A9N9CMG7_9GLOM|nr:5314_t:CDS:2 [Ambispora gerdemannii]
MSTSFTEVTSNFGIPTPPPAFDNLDEKNPFFSSSSNGTGVYSPDPTSPIITNTTINNSSSISTNNMNRQNNVSSRKSRSRYVIADDSMLSTIIPMVMKEHNIESTDSYDNDSLLSYSSPDQDENQIDPGMIFRFPVVFFDDKSVLQNTPTVILTGDSLHSQNTSDDNKDGNTRSTVSDYDPTKTISTPSATIIHRPLLLSDVVRSMSLARRPRYRPRPVTRKNKKEDESITGLDLLFDAAALSTNQSCVTSTNSTINSSSYKNTPSSTERFNNNTTINHLFYYISGKRRASMSLSSISSMPNSDLSDLDDVNIDNYGDDEGDPEFLPNPKKLKLGTGSGLGITASSTPVSSFNNNKHIAKTNNNSLAMNNSTTTTTATTRERKEANHRTKICASCRTKSTPCWRPGWRPNLFLCNSCGLRYKKTKCVCPNLECRYIPLKSEFNAMFKKQKSGDVPEAKRCCKCQTYIATNGNWRI